MKNDVYAGLRERLNEYSIGFKSTGTGVEIQLLKTLFTDKEAEMYLNLTRSLQTARDIAEKQGNPRKQRKKFFRK